MAGTEHKESSIEEKEMSKRPEKKEYNDEDPELSDTVFIRNLATFDTTQESLKEYVETNFGETVYCLICKDKETGMSKGTAFVKFKSPETAQQCLDEFENPELQTKFFLDGRNIFVLPALTRERITEVKRAKAPIVEAEDAPKKKKKPRHNRPQPRIPSEARKSTGSGAQEKNQSKQNRSIRKGNLPPGKDKQKKGTKQSNRPSKHGNPKQAVGNKLKKNLKKKKKVMGKKISQKSRGRH